MKVTLFMYHTHHAKQKTQNACVDVMSFHFLIYYNVNFIITNHS
jgi:hypothetical protein